MNNNTLLALQSFKNQAFRLIPQLANSDMTDIAWQDIKNRYEKRQRQRLTSSFLLALISQVTGIEYDILATSFTLPRSQRHPVSSSLPSVSMPKTRKRHYHAIEHNDANLIMAKTAKISELSSPLKQLGVRLAHLTPATPTKGYPETKRTPNKTLVRPLYRNGQGQQLYKPLTPYHTKEHPGMVNTNRAQRQWIAQQLPKLPLERVTTCYFEATLAKINQAHGKARPLSQFQLMGATCRDVFLAHDIRTGAYLELRGIDHHWSHLRGFCLGGSQTANNLIPGTSASNYNTFHLVEQFIIEKLTADTSTPITSIHIEVVPYYSGESLIPDLLDFNLTWHETNQTGIDVAMTETISINPRSYQTICKTARHAIQLLRDKALNHDKKDSIHPTLK